MKDESRQSAEAAPEGTVPPDLSESVVSPAQDAGGQAKRRSVFSAPTFSPFEDNSPFKKNSSLRRKHAAKHSSLIYQNESFPRTFGFSGGISGGLSSRPAVRPGEKAAAEEKSAPLKRAEKEGGFRRLPPAEEMDLQFGRVSPKVWEDLGAVYRRTPRRPTVLLINPDQEKSRNLSSNLETDGYIAVSVSDLSEALRIAKLLSLDLVICNLELLGRDAGSFVRHLRKLPNNADVPLIITGSEEVDDEEAYERFGADAFCIEEEAQQSVLALASFYLSS